MAIRKPDAFILPDNFAAPNGTPGRAGKIGAKINAALGGTAQLGMDARLGRLFARVDPHQTRLFPIGHDREGEDRYDWFVAEDAAGGFAPVAPVSGFPGESARAWIGYLKDGAAAPPPALDPEVQAALDRRMEEVRSSPEFAEQMAKLQVRGSEDA